MSYRNRIRVTWMEGLSPKKTLARLIEVVGDPADAEIARLTKEREDAKHYERKFRGLLQMANNTSKRRGKERDELKKRIAELEGEISDLKRHGSNPLCREEVK